MTAPDGPKTTQEQAIKYATHEPTCTCKGVTVDEGKRKGYLAGHAEGFKEGVEASARLVDSLDETEVCSACSGSGHYDHNGSPKCGACDGKGEINKYPNESPSDSILTLLEFKR